MSQDELLWPNTTSIQSPVGLEQSTELELWITQALTISDPLFQILSAVLLLIFSALLAFKTKVSGRWLIFSCPTILFVNLIFQKISNPSFPHTIGATSLDIAFSKFIISFAFFVGVLGLVKLSWSLYKNENS